MSLANTDPLATEQLSPPTNDELEQMARHAEIDQLIDYLTELRLAEREIMKKHGFKTYDAVKLARTKVADYLGTEVLRRNGFLIQREERITFAMPEYCPKCGHQNATRIPNFKLNLREDK